jgi:hypothetical protein
MVVDLQHRCETLILEEIKTVDGLRFRPPHQCQSFGTRHVDGKRRLEWIARFQTHKRRENGSSARPASRQKDAGARLDARTIIKNLDAQPRYLGGDRFKDQAYPNMRSPRRCDAPNGASRRA